VGPNQIPRPHAPTAEHAPIPLPLRAQYHTKRDLERERAAYEAMDDAARIKWEDEFTRKHLGQDYSCPPVLPYNDSCVDVLHLWLNVVKVGVRHVFSRPFTDKEQAKRTQALRDEMAGIKASLNERMAQDFGNVEFGGSEAFALTGPQVRIMLAGGKEGGGGTMLIDLLNIIQPYHDMLESDGSEPKEKEGEGAGAGASSAAAASTSKRGGKQKGQLTKAQKKAAAVAAARSKKRKQPDRPVVRLKVVAMLVAFCKFYSFMHEINTRKSSEILHDAAYGMAKLYLILGKPYLEALKGDERGAEKA